MMVPKGMALQGHMTLQSSPLTFTCAMQSQHTLYTDRMKYTGIANKYMTAQNFCLYLIMCTQDFKANLCVFSPKSSNSQCQPFCSSFVGFEKNMGCQPDLTMGCYFLTAEISALTT